MYKHQAHPYLNRKVFFRKQTRYTLVALTLITISLGIGTAGYHYFGLLPWTDAWYNASMILTGMGPVDRMESQAAKIFSGCYALYSGVAFLSTVAVFLTPLVHRFMHLLHVEQQE